MKTITVSLIKPNWPLHSCWTCACVETTLNLNAYQPPTCFILFPHTCHYLSFRCKHDQSKPFSMRWKIRSTVCNADVRIGIYQQSQDDADVFCVSCFFPGVSVTNWKYDVSRWTVTWCEINCYCLLLDRKGDAYRVNTWAIQHLWLIQDHHLTSIHRELVSVCFCNMSRNPFIVFGSFLFIFLPGNCMTHCVTKCTFPQ